jgi:hypothetical protein
MKSIGCGLSPANNLALSASRCFQPFSIISLRRCSISRFRSSLIFFRQFLQYPEDGVFFTRESTSQSGQWKSNLSHPMRGKTTRLLEEMFSLFPSRKCSFSSLRIGRPSNSFSTTIFARAAYDAVCSLACSGWLPSSLLLTRT